MTDAYHRFCFGWGCLGHYIRITTAHIQITSTGAKHEPPQR